MITTLELVVLVGASITALGVIFLLLKKSFAGMKKFRMKVDQAVDAINGRAQVLHPETGVELLPPAPGIVERVALMEEVQATMAESVGMLASTSDRLTSLESRVLESLEEIKKDKDSQHTELWQAISRLNEVAKRHHSDDYPNTL